MKSYSLAALAELLNGSVVGDEQKQVTGVASLATATRSDVAYFDNPSRRDLLKRTKAGVVLLQQSVAGDCPVPAICVANPFLSISKVVQLFQHEQACYSDIHPSANVELCAEIADPVLIGAHSLVGKNTMIGSFCQIGANCVIEADVEIGKHCIIGNGVVIAKGSRIGNGVVLDAQSVIGARPYNVQKEAGSWKFGPDIGGVVIEDNCYIGAGTIIDRGSMSDTLIQEGSFLDNLIQVGHDVVVGKGVAIAGCAAIGAHTSIGAHCILGGACAIAANLELAENVTITGMSRVSKSLHKPGVYSSGTMVADHRTWRKNAARFRRLDDYVKRLKALENI